MVGARHWLGESRSQSTSLYRHTVVGARHWLGDSWSQSTGLYRHTMVGARDWLGESRSQSTSLYRHTVVGARHSKKVVQEIQQPCLWSLVTWRNSSPVHRSELLHGRSSSSLEESRPQMYQPFLVHSRSPSLPGETGPQSTGRVLLHGRTSSSLETLETVASRSSLLFCPAACKQTQREMSLRGAMSTSTLWPLILLGQTSWLNTFSFNHSS